MIEGRIMEKTRSTQHTHTNRAAADAGRQVNVTRNDFIILPSIILSFSRLLLSFISLFSLPVLFAAEVPGTTSPPPPIVTLQDFKLVGALSGDRAVFTFTATANVENSKGGSLELLSGALALTEEIG